ncbi:MAG TPA: glycosyltransferase family 4 protein [Gemmatimonadales bacterium]|nr:glycosyltransferase family 4 protein [Gemmatimonadales bacterium]
MPVMLPVARRVLLTADPIGGVWTYAVELARALSGGLGGGAPMEVCVAVMGAALRPDQRRDLAGLPGVEVRECRYRLEWMPDAWADVDAAGDWLLSLEREIAPDVIHLNQFAPGVLPWRAPRLVVAHSCVCSWWRAVHGVAAPPEWDEYRLRLGAGLAGADLVIAPTRAMLAALEREHGPLAAAAAIPNARAARTPPLARGARAQKEELILAVGRLWDEAKNVGMLAQLAPELEWPVYLAGDTQHPSGRAAGSDGAERDGAAPDRTGAGHAGSAARFLGRLDAPVLARWLRRAAIYALPARYEPFGLSVLEAALAGCALVLGDIPSQRELWDGAALFVKPDDADTLRGVLRTLMVRGEMRRALADAARRRARSFTVERFAMAYRAAYARAAARAYQRRGVPAPRPAEVACAS